MATLKKDQSGAFLPVGSQGLTPIQGEATGSVPFVSQGADPNDPLTKFNTAILGMLQKAQGGAGNEDLFGQQRQLQRAAIGRASEITPEELRVLSPSQQSAIRSGKIEALEPEIDAVATAVKSRDSRLANFEKMLGTVKDLGQDFLKNVSPSKEVIDGYKNMIRAGAQPTSIPDEIRNKVMSSLSPEDWAAWGAENRKGQQAGLTSNQQAARVDRLSSGFKTEDIVKRYNSAGFEAQAALNIPDTTNDQGLQLALIYAFAKVMDPDSAVKEGEFETAKKYAQGPLQKFKKDIERFATGKGFLTPDAIIALKGAINNKMGVLRKQYDNVYNTYRSRIVEAGGDEGDLVAYHQGFESGPQTKVVKGVTYTKGQDGKWYKQK